MPRPGTGGLPARRPDQRTTPGPPTQAPGGAAGTVRARIVEIIGGAGSGVFVYSGSPSTGDLVASLVGATTADPFGNATVPNGLTVYGANGQAIALSEKINEGQLIFFTGSGFEGAPGNMTGHFVGSGATAAMDLEISGPKATGAEDDWVQMLMVSGNEGGTSGAVGQFIYVNTGGVPTVALQWNSAGVVIPTLNATLTGTVNGINPGTFTMAFAGAAAGAPGSTYSQAYLTAFASTYNTTIGAVNDIVNGLDGWGV